MAVNSNRPYYPATAEIERKEREFEAHYRDLLDAVGEKHLKPETGLEMVLQDFKKLQADPGITSVCVYAGREQEFREAFYLAGQRAELGMDKSATKSLAQLAEEKVPEREKTFSWLVPVGALALAFGLSFISGDRSRVPDCEQRAPGEIRHSEHYQPQFLRDDYKKKEPEKEEKKDKPAPKQE